MAAKKSGILDWRKDFWDWSISSPFIWKVMSSIPGHDSTIHSVRGESKPERRSGKRIVAGTAFRLEFQVH